MSISRLLSHKDSLNALLILEIELREKPPDLNGRDNWDQDIFEYFLYLSYNLDTSHKNQLHTFISLAEAIGGIERGLVKYISCDWA